MTRREIAVASWGVLGVLLVLGESVARLTRVAVARIAEGLAPHEWAALAAAMVVMGYVEGYRTFARSFGPSVVARAFALGRAPAPLHVLCAPLYAMSLVGDTRARVARSWAVVAGVVAAVLVVRRLPPTWRSIVDASVALSLTWGIVVIVVLWARRLFR
ncbi:MAG: hypothetical protein KIT84_16655 [Labilithrix sp.]|nr:hypothetical protein [Labilithrix sp.]MCW5812662.1 hypothetical protein [Labilithrix sp.]